MPEITEATELTKRPSGNFELYEKRGDRWFCKTCGGEVKAVIKHAPVWDGPFSCSGSGEVAHWQEPYCLNCEVKPL